MVVESVTIDTRRLLQSTYSQPALPITPNVHRTLQVAKSWCGLFPLALAVVDASGDAPRKMERHGPMLQQQVFSSSFNSVVGVSLAQLDPASRDSFVRLGVLAERAVVPKDLLCSLWEQVTTLSLQRYIDSPVTEWLRSVGSGWAQRRVDREVFRARALFGLQAGQCKRDALVR